MPSANTRNVLLIRNRTPSEWLFALDAGRSLDGIGGGHGMDELSDRHLGHTTLTFKDICGSGKKAIPFGEVPLDKATQYAAEKFWHSLG